MIAERDRRNAELAAKEAAEAKGKPSAAKGRVASAVSGLSRSQLRSLMAETASWAQLTYAHILSHLSPLPAGSGTRTRRRTSPQRKLRRRSPSGRGEGVQLPPNG